VPLLTIKVKTKRRSWWLYAMSAILSLLISAFWAWVAFSVLGFSPTLSKEVLIVFAAISLVFCPLFYFANERQVRDHGSKALLLTSIAFVVSFASSVFYFIAKHNGDAVFGIVFGIISIGIGVVVSLFAIRYEFE
jgi:uncharacterized membrane protein